MTANPVDSARLKPPAPPRPRTLEALRQLLEQASAHRALHLPEALVESGFVDTHTVALARKLQMARKPEPPLGQVLLEQGAIKPAELDAVMSGWQGVPTIDLRDLTPQAEALARVPAALAQREVVLPLLVHDGVLVVAVPDAWNRSLLADLRFASDLRIMPVLALPGTLAPMVATAYAGSAADTAAAAPEATPAGQLFALRDVHKLAAELSAQSAPSDRPPESEADSTLVRLINTLISDAIEHRASDIHIETAEAPRRIRIRLRVDGQLMPYLEVPAEYRFALIGRLKIMASLDISEHRKPQDGKIDFARFGGQNVELRMVTVPTSRGLEDIVLRLLSGVKPMPLDRIDLTLANLDGLRSVMSKPYGLILVCGPTGSGKTTTLHSVMRELNTDNRKIWTAENPVEITQEGLRQVQVNARIGWTFAAAMRTFLRADPDVIMVGEMRDQETASIGVEASLTGHLVLSTLHTNSAPESVTRLLELGIDPFSFSDSLLAILAQRLARRLCKNCRVPRLLDDKELVDLADMHLASARAASDGRDALIERWKRDYGTGAGASITMHGHGGCAACDGTGYHGRVGIHELMVSNDAVRELVRHRASAAELQAAALAGGMVTLRQDGIEKALAGLIDMPEVLAASNT